MVVQNPQGPGSLLAPFPFVLSGLLPFLTGTLLAGVAGYPVSLGVFLLGAVGVAALVKAAFASRETFAPEAGRCPRWQLVSVGRSEFSAYAALAVAALMGLILQFGWRTGDLTIPLGALGALGGYFYFAPPLHWHRRGWGEGVGGLCFGLLPVVAGFYLQYPHLVTEVLLYGVPLTLAAFNVFLIYGFPDPREEGPPSPHSLAARRGPVPGALIYTLVNILTIAGLAFCLWFPASPLPWRAGLWPLLILAVVNQELIKRKFYRDEARLTLLCRLTLTLHLGLGLVFSLMLWQRL